MSGRQRFKYVIGLLAGVALLFGVTRFVNLASALAKFDDYPWPQLGIVLLLSLIYYLLKALRWHYLLDVLGVRLPLRRSLLLYLAGQWFAVTPAGEFVRAYLLSGYGFSLSRGSAAVTAQVVFDFLSLAIVGSIAMFWHAQFARLVLPFTAALMVGVLLFAYGPTLWRRGRDPDSKQHGNHGSRWDGFYQHSRQLLALRSLAIGLALGVPAVLVGSGVLYAVALGYQVPIDVAQSAYIYSLSQLAGALSMLPHGLGAIEGSSVALFYHAGVDTAYAASAVVLFRLCTLGWSLALGGLALLLLRTPLAGPAVHADGATRAERP